MRSIWSLVCLSLCLLVSVGLHRSVGGADETRQVEVTGTAAAANEVTAEKLARAPKDVDLYRGCQFRFLVMVKETPSGNRSGEGSPVEIEIALALIEHGYKVIDSSRYTRPDYILPLPGTFKESLRFDADVCVLGEVKSLDERLQPSGFFSARSRVEVKAILVESGIILADARSERGGAGLSLQLASRQSMENAGKAVAQDLIKLLAATARKDVPIELAVHGLGDQADVDRFQQEAHNVSKILRVSLQDFSLKEKKAVFTISATACK